MNTKQALKTKKELKATPEQISTFLVIYYRKLTQMFLFLYRARLLIQIWKLNTWQLTNSELKTHATVIYDLLVTEK